VDRLKPDEQLAAEVLQSRLGGTIDPKDVCGAQATHDFDLVLADGQRIAVEVTNAADEDMERLRGESERRYPAPRLAVNWRVRLPKDPRLKLDTLLRELEPLVVVLERHGVEHVGHDVQAPYDPEAAEAARCIARLRVHDARRFTAPEPDEGACLMLTFHSRARVIDPDALLNALVTDRAEAKRDVLARAEAADACHLFIWVRHVDAWIGMTDLPSPPPEAPELPRPIDVVWAATDDPLSGSGKLYRLESGGVWEAFP